MLIRDPRVYIAEVENPNFFHREVEILQVSFSPGTLPSQFQPEYWDSYQK